MQQEATPSRIDDYANSMFAFEYLHDKWINNCASYLTYIFGDTLKNAIVVDYAFGRGNWSIAFLRAGAKHIYAIDASDHNVDKFKHYCTTNRIQNISIEVGNILNFPPNYSADIIWAYGIYPLIENKNLFLRNLSSFAKNENSSLYLYAYEQESLREFIVTTCRKYITYTSEALFRKNSHLFSPSARLRARDDLTAPYISWESLKSLKHALESASIYITHSTQSFNQFLGIETQHGEFSPHHLMCTFTPNENLLLRKTNPLTSDINILKEISNLLTNTVFMSEMQRKQFATALFNTHFSALQYNNEAYPPLIQDFLYLFYCIIHNKCSFELLSYNTKKILKLALSSLKGNPEKNNSNKHRDFLENYLRNNTIRI